MSNVPIIIWIAAIAGVIIAVLLGLADLITRVVSRRWNAERLKSMVGILRKANQKEEPTNE